MSLDVRKQINTECQRCANNLETYRIVLPCAHTFCHKCVTFNSANDKDETVACPLCHEEFTLPVTAIENQSHGLSCDEQPKAVTDTPISYCEGCNQSEATGRRKQASVYCIHCQQKFCDDCANNHRNYRPLRGHKLVEIDQATVEQTTDVFCTEHKHEPLKLYCFNCKNAICSTCVAESHQTHRHSQLNEVADELCQDLNETINNYRNQIETYETAMEEFTWAAEQTEVKISLRAEELKRMIDSQKMKLTQELASHKKDRLESIQRIFDGMEQQIKNMVEYTEDLKNKGTTGDIVLQARGLHIKAEQLQKLNDFKLLANVKYFANVTFEAAEVPLEVMQSLIGTIIWKHANGICLDFSLLVGEHFVSKMSDSLSGYFAKCFVVSGMLLDLRQ
jgi:B-box zinc finger/Zinc finger, C3HC4 type (RING finger)